MLEEFLLIQAQVAELVDAHVSGACVSRRAGSSPVLGTGLFRMNFMFGEVAELVDALLFRMNFMFGEVAELVDALL